MSLTTKTFLYSALLVAAIWLVRGLLPLLTPPTP